MAKKGAFIVSASPQRKPSVDWGGSPSMLCASRRSSLAEGEALNIFTAGDRAQAFEDTALVELQLVAQGGVADVNDQRVAAADAFRGAAVCVVGSDDLLPVPHDVFLNAFLANAVAFPETFEYLSHGGCLAGETAALLAGEAPQVGDEVAHLAVEGHGKRD